MIVKRTFVLRRAGRGLLWLGMMMFQKRASSGGEVQKRPGQEKLERWQAWQFSGGWRTNAYYVERVDGTPLHGDGLSANDAEALVTDRFVTQLPKHILRSVKMVYLDRIGNSREGYAQKLRINVHTLDGHLEQAYSLIEGMWDTYLTTAEHKRAALLKNNFATNELSA